MFLGARGELLLDGQNLHHPVLQPYRRESYRQYGSYVQDGNYTFVVARHLAHRTELCASFKNVFWNVSEQTERNNQPVLDGLSATQRRSKPPGLRRTQLSEHLDGFGDGTRRNAGLHAVDGPLLVDRQFNRR
jgi:hypothetical protein